MKKREPTYNSSKGDLTNGPIRKHLVRLTLPMIWGLFAVIFVQLADVYFISVWGDTDTLAGISFTFPVTMLISHLVFGFNIAMSSVVARLIGEKRYDDMRRIVLHGTVTGFIVTVIVAAVTYVHLEHIFYAMGADEVTYPVIKEYMPLWLVAVCVLALTKVNSAMRAGGDTVTPALVMSVIALVNLALDPLLVFGLWGFPEMGVKGAAVATLVAFIVGAIYALYAIIVPLKMMAVDSLHLDKFKDSMKRLAVIAIPAGIANTVVPLSMTIITALLAAEGAQAVAAFGVAGRVEALAMLVIIALATSMAPIIGQNWGAKIYARVDETINLSILINLVWSAICAVILAIFAEPIARSFTDDVTVIEYTVKFFYIVPITYGIGNIVFGWASSFNAIGQPKYAFMIIIIRALVLALPAAYIGGMLNGVIGVFVSIALMNLVSGIGVHLWSRVHCKKAAAARDEALAAVGQ
ncbi:MAG: MATE family efflux transporter [Micavibrio sp.]|nr:MATE family efflux transporter [Micavibrio sp.]